MVCIVTVENRYVYALLSNLFSYLLAYNLAWKISEVLKNTAKDPEQLLDSYQIEVCACML